MNDTQYEDSVLGAADETHYRALKQAACPSCGVCPTCGRSSVPHFPAWPPYNPPYNPYPPTWPYNPVIYCNAG